MAMLEEAIRRRATYVRLVTDSTNTGAIHMMEKLSLRQVGAFAPFRANPLDVQAPSRAKLDYRPEGTQIATLDDIDEIIDYMNVSNVFPAVGGLYYIGFVAHEITAALLEQYILAQQIYLLRRWNRLDGLAIAEPREDRQGKRLESVYVYAPDLMLIRDGLTGLEYEWDSKIFYTYERGLV
ncbi:MAG: hypothetical protein NVSMB38_45290 [Ktedonobacteraceae bacterium]